MLTHDAIRSMKETVLQEKVLVPLLRAMGFRDVAIRQGVNELGKDIIMWKPDELDQRVDYAVVAKAVKLTGRVKGGTGSASTVELQIRQALASRFEIPSPGSCVGFAASGS